MSVTLICVYVINQRYGVISYTCGFSDQWHVAPSQITYQDNQMFGYLYCSLKSLYSCHLKQELV